MEEISALPTMRLHMDNGGKAGHAYVELINTSGESEIYGFYPSDSWKVWDNGEIRDDQIRYQQNMLDDNVNLITKTMPLSSEEFERATEAIKNFQDEPKDYDWESYNCVDFVQDVYAATKNDDSDFLSLFNEEEVGNLGLVGQYADVYYDTKEEAQGTSWWDNFSLEFPSFTPLNNEEESRIGVPNTFIEPFEASKDYYQDEQTLTAEPFTSTDTPVAEEIEEGLEDLGMME